MPFTKIDASNLGGTTLPSAITSASGLTTGKVLQVLSASTTTKRSTSSTSFVDVTGLSINITPSSSSNKILCMASIKGIASDNSNDDAVSFRLVRDSTQIDIATNLTLYSSNYQLNFALPLMTLDSPSSSSQLTYKVQFASRLSNSSSMNNTSPNDESEIVVMEIASWV